MESPDVFLLGQIRWQFFGTLTFKSERLPERVRLALWFALLRKAAKRFHRHFPKLPWCLRQEDGETTGRRHFHFLLAGLPPDAVNLQTCFWLMAHWENLGGGMARISLFDPRLNAAGYLTKTGQGSPDAGDHYESAKFGHDACHLMLSHGAKAILASLQLSGQRGRSALRRELSHE